jgi:3-carboxy-cis,cis-muconate cycloisomerase
VTVPAAFDWGLLEPLGGAAAAASDDAVLAALVDVERALVLAWGDVSDEPDAAEADADARTASRAVADALRIEALDVDALLAGAREGGVPVIPLVAQLRAQAEGAHPGSGWRVHDGATSQDILDSALVLVAKLVLDAARGRLVAAGKSLAALADAERSTVSIARTLGQHAEATTFGAHVATWLDAVTSAIDIVQAARFPVQLGGAVGTGLQFDERQPGVTARLRAATAAQLDLDDPGRAWHTDRTPVLVLGDAAAAVVAACGRIGRDVAFLARTEIGELTVARTGGSSAMPHKRNPVDAVLLTANGLRAAGLVATLHAAAVSQDARPAGEWHAEWQALRSLLRLAAESSDAAADLVAGLTVEHDAIARTLALSPELLRDRDAVTAAAGGVVDAAVARFHAAEEAAG